MKLIKWLLIIAVIAAGIFLLKDIAGHEGKTVSKINAGHTKEVEQYTIGITKNVQQKINQDVKQGYKGLPMGPSNNQ
ncbi:MAG: hypothetical protein M1491_10160 [Deltaproteobacteria bacterium]|nr:hypothetical protein [Deltaproteobacteria bacterium]MCL5277607.1 hypothetical protein [Deltaproteobacteria bacterium]